MDESSPVRICILGVTFETGNMGVSMLAAGTIHAVLRRFPNAQVTVLDYGLKSYDFSFDVDDRQYPIRFVNIRFSKNLYLSNNIAVLLSLAAVRRLIRSRWFQAHLLRHNKYLAEIVNADLVVSMAYGDSFSDIYGMSRLFYVALPQVLAVLCGSKLILLPQTIGPFRRRFSSAVARYILRNADVVYSRDTAGLIAARTLLWPVTHKRLRFCYDLAFDVDAKRPSRLPMGLPAKAGRTGAYVGVNISGLLLRGGYTRDNMFGLTVSYEELVHKLIALLIERKFTTVVLIPHVFGSENDLESDSTACEKVFQDLCALYDGKIQVVRETYAYDEMKYIIGQCDFFIGARMHACIGALSQCVPTVSIAYSDKFAGVMQTIGCTDLVVDPRHMESNQIVQAVNDIYDRRSSVAQDLRLKMPVVRRTVRQLFAENQEPEDSPDVGRTIKATAPGR